MGRPRLALGLLSAVALALLVLAGLGTLLRHRGLEARDAGDWRTAESRLHWASRLLPGQGVDLDLAETRLRRGDALGAERLLPSRSGAPEALRWMLVRARVDRQRNRVDEALAGFRAALRAARALGHGEAELSALLGEAEVLYASLGQLDEGEAKLAEARTLAESLQGHDGAMGHVLLAEASFHWSHRLDRSRAPQVLDAALERFERAADDHGRARAMARLGLAHLADGDFARHTELQEEARAIYQRLGDRVGLAVTESFLGAVLAALERYPEARTRYDRALETYRAVGSVVGERGILRLIAGLELRTGQLDSARRLLEGLLADTRPTVERRHVLVLLGNVLMHQDEPAAAAERYREAFRLDERLRPVDYQYRHVPLVMLAHAEHQTGNLDAALAALEDARLDAVAIDNYPGIATVELAMADFLDSQSLDSLARPSEVLDHLESAAAIQAARLGESRMPFFQTQFEQAFERLRVLLFERGVHSEEKARALDLTFQLLELMRFRLHRGLVRDVGDVPSVDGDVAGGPREAEALEELRGVLVGGDPAAIRQAYRRLGDAVALDRLQTTETPTRPISRRELQAWLDPETTVVEYVFAGDAVLALGIVDAHLEAVQLPLSRRQLKDQVRLFMSQLESGERWLPLAVRLREALIAPLEAVGMQRGGRLVIVPVGPLHQLAFPALARLEDDGERVFLIDDWDLLMASSASALLQDATKPGSPGVATFARGTEAAPLPAAVEEALAFARTLGGVALTGDEATESAAREALEHRRWLHLAVHGVAESEVPLHSRLLLAADDEHDGRLTAREILDLRVGSELVILSACRTGLGFSERADDWTAADRVGLSEALLEAGAGRVVSSLLPLEDRPTAEFVAALAERLRSDPDPVSALASAQRTLARTHPVEVWAGFRIAGHL